MKIDLENVYLEFDFEKDHFKKKVKNLILSPACLRNRSYRPFAQKCISIRPVVVQPVSKWRKEKKDCATRA